MRIPISSLFVWCFAISILKTLRPKTILTLFFIFLVLLSFCILFCLFWTQFSLSLRGSLSSSSSSSVGYLRMDVRMYQPLELSVLQ